MQGHEGINYPPRILKRMYICTYISIYLILTLSDLHFFCNPIIHGYHHYTTITATFLLLFKMKSEKKTRQTNRRIKKVLRWVIRRWEIVWVKWSLENRLNSKLTWRTTRCSEKRFANAFVSLSLSLTHSLTHSYYLDTYRWCIYSVNSPVTTHSNRSIRRDAILMLHVNLNPLGLNDVCDLLCDHLSFVYILLRRSWISCSITRSYTRIAVIIQFYEKSSIIVFSTREGFMWGRQYVLIEDVLRWVSDIYRSGDRCYSREHRTLQFIIKDYYS